MATDVTVPALGESVSEATVISWMKAVGDSVEKDEPLCELETDKVSIEVPSPVAGAITEIAAEEGSDVEVGALLCRVEEGAEGSSGGGKSNGDGEDAKQEAAPKEEPKQEEAPREAPEKEEPAAAPATNETLSPAVQKMVSENNLDPSKIPATGPKGNITKEDVQNYLQGGGQSGGQAKSAPPVEAGKAAPPGKESVGGGKPAAPSFEPKGDRPMDPRGEERVKLSKLRKVIATRLKEAQNTAAMLTTFNEVDMGPMMELRSEYKDRFEKKHGVKLGFMSFFVKAATVALKELPAVNAEIYGDEIIYKNYYDIGIAVGTPQGLVVPVLRDADQKSFAEIEGAIADFGKRARDGKLTMAEMQGGTFTITNGGVFGSLLSTPIINPPQSGILGMHKIQKRPIVDSNGDIVVGNMMYVAHSYDHRIIDGREAVTFLVRLKEVLEDPARLLIDV
ncbi:2-oxoglutarate dehydrogenase complex dihydrolipoyllysine-residue succinyltransferase [Marivibrio halodurans]|uniref:Dihydrolipoyllysine-residue succinyltransferase component of 2-oxoglutarate dehydrogenase complex n=1 Tax=Marivibrio halodurans TaxID=2039722 RepID=A0A8J7S5B0_9PROT|nr:2-oxoglutarate dehydrogenase complex dihydrolipoyllysine-residue succinyltransferase [Marivibrio halodurans]MBP5858793.1 2-oxoglutarate dehydrogenase complex dihydrolipoyllysine-residue succinyltransferase [Marivibrio halodurans]